MVERLARLWSWVLNRRTWAILVLVALGGGLAVWRLLAAGQEGSTYTTATVKYADVAESVSASGQVEPVQQVTLTFKSQGYVEQCNVKVGDQVKAGQVLAVERSDDLKAQLTQAQAGLAMAQAKYEQLVSTQPAKVAQAEAQVDQAKSNLELAKLTLERTEPMVEAGLASQAELDAAQNSYQSALSQYKNAVYNLELTKNPADIESAAAQVKSAQAQVVQAENSFDNARITAPFDGFVAQIDGNVGQWTGGTGESSQFAIIVSSTVLQLAAQVNEADISKVRVGQAVTFTVDTYPDKTFSGKVISLAPLATTVNNVQVYDAVIAIDDYSGLRAGLPASVNIIINQARHVLVVPQSALDYGAAYRAANRQRRGQRSGAGASAPGSRLGQNGATTDAARQSGAGAANRSTVVVLEGDKEVLKPVQTGLTDGVNVEIKSGLAAGDIVVTGTTGVAQSSASSTGQRSTSGSAQRSLMPMPGGPGRP